jgi:hypothetical protein
MNIQDFCKIQIYKIEQSSRTTYQNFNVVAVANVCVYVEFALIVAPATAAADDGVVEAAVDRCL